MVSGPVIEVVKGGLIVDIGLRGFLPASLVELRRVRELQPYVGKVIEAKIIELDRNRNNVVLSRRAWLEEAQKEQRGDFLQNLKPGERRKGIVSSVVNFGAFVDLGGMDGLVHVSELSWKHVDHPSSVVSVGDEIEVEVLDVDLDKERISLSLKATQSDPWQEFADSHSVGQLVYGRITKLVPFGAFVQVGDGIEGLVHISEMAAHHVDLPEQVVTPGEELWVKIIDIDLQRRRISLSIKQAAEGGEVSEEYREAFGEHAYDDEGNYIGFDYAEGEFTPETEAQAAWADFATEVGTQVHPPDGEGGEGAAIEGAAAERCHSRECHSRGCPSRGCPSRECHSRGCRRSRSRDPSDPGGRGRGDTHGRLRSASASASASGQPSARAVCSRGHRPGRHDMDEARARDLLAVERRRVEGLLRDLTDARQGDEDEASVRGDIADPAEPLTDEQGDDAVAVGLRERLGAIERAEARLADGTYGRSVRSGVPIPDERLEADPAAELTVEEQAAADITADETIAENVVAEEEADEEALSGE